ncbi:MAG: RnfABCDGE type electron transport complex subunit D [Deltaproteobacteria bacterium]|nr:RnfABCDGE type electron transport complex subunit D [Deltaproteobacteria bacterium]
MMVHVMVGLVPCLAGAVYLFGLRALVLALFVSALGIVTEGCFTLRQGKPITSAVLVTSLIFVLSLPPNIPFWMAAVGIVFAVVFGKMVFGGFGFNAFNPAMVGRCFIYIAFPMAMTNQWFDPFPGTPGGFAEWSPAVDAVTGATPLQVLREGGSIPLERLLAGTYTANPLYWICAGSFLFGAFFVATEPITAPKNKSVQWVYGFIIGSLIMVFRQYSSFSEGVMFSVLFMNIFAAVMDVGAREWKGRDNKAS